MWHAGSSMRVNCFKRNIHIGCMFGVRPSILSQSFNGGCTTRLPQRNKIKDEQNLAKVSSILDLEKFSIHIERKQECIKCFYVLKNPRVELSNGAAYYTEQLEKIGRDVLHLQLSESFLYVFKRSKSDVNGLDFNFISKMQHLSVAKRSPPLLLRMFLRNNKIGNLARLAVPESVTPLRVQRGYDYRCFNAIIGYVALTNEKERVDKFIRERISKRILRQVFRY